MQVGDLVRVKNSTTGDNSQMVKLWRERTPLLVWALQPEIGWAHVLDGERIELFRLTDWRF